MARLIIINSSFIQGFESPYIFKISLNISAKLDVNIKLNDLE